MTTGWVARTWDPAVRKRFQLLLKNWHQNLMEKSMALIFQKLQ